MICPHCYAQVPAGATQCQCGFVPTATATNRPMMGESTPEVPPVPSGTSGGGGGGRIAALIISGAMLIGGIVLTVASHDMAASSGRGRYRVFTGLIIFGAIGLFRTLFSGKK